MQVSVEGHYNAVKPQVLGEELLGGWTIGTQEQIPTDPHARVLDSGRQVAQVGELGLKQQLHGAHRSVAVLGRDHIENFRGGGAEAHGLILRFWRRHGIDSEVEVLN